MFLHQSCHAYIYVVIDSSSAKRCIHNHLQTYYLSPYSVHPIYRHRHEDQNQHDSKYILNSYTYSVDRCHTLKAWDQGLYSSCYTEQALEQQRHPSTKYQYIYHCLSLHRGHQHKRNHYLLTAVGHVKAYNDRNTIPMLSFRV